MRSRTSAWGLALALCGACSNDPPAEPPARTRAVEPPPADSSKECRDWSTLDLTQLAPLTEGKHAPLLDQVWRRVLEKHYDPTLGCLRWGALREEYARKVAEATADAEAYGHINALLDELGQSHLRLFGPGQTEDAPGPAAPDLTVRWIEDQLVVVHSRAEGPQGPVLAGAVLHGIGDRSIEPLVEQVRGRSESHEFALEIARAVAVRLSCERAGQVKKLKVTNPAKDGRMAIRVVPCVSPQGERVTLGNLRDIPTRVESRMLPGKVGLLAFNVWMLPMVQRVQAAVKELRGQGMRALVLDLRGNPGGLGAMAVPVARMLLPKEASLGTLRFRDFEQELNVENVEGSFRRPVAVLVDEGTASTSEIFVVGMRDQERITVVGSRPSAGAALPSVIEQMTGGALLQYVVADYRSPAGTVVEGKGIVPDLVVAETRQDFEAGRDPVLEAALEHLRAAAGPAPEAALEASGSGEPEPSGSETSGEAGLEASGSDEPEPAEVPASNHDGTPG